MKIWQMTILNHFRAKCGKTANVHCIFHRHSLCPQAICPITSSERRQELGMSQKCGLPHLISQNPCIKLDIIRSQKILQSFAWYLRNVILGNHFLIVGLPDLQR